MEIEHRIFSGDLLVKSFSNSNEYDTATPYQYCISELKTLKQNIENGSKLKIESHGELYEINNLDAYKKWMKAVFKGGFEKFVF